MLYLGVDPGQSGGLAVIGPHGQIIDAIKMPETDRDILDFLLRFSDDQDGIHAMIERVHASPKMGVVSSFTFGRGVGALKMALTAARIPYDEVTPQRWQKALGCLQPKRAGGAEFGKKDKNITKRRAQALFPAAKITHALADALLIAEHNRRSFAERQLSATIRQRFTTARDANSEQVISDRVDLVFHPSDTWIDPSTHKGRNSEDHGKAKGQQEEGVQKVSRAHRPRRVSGF